MKFGAVIDSVIIDSTKESCLQPIIVNFQNGQLKDDETNNMKSGVFFDERSGRTVLTLSNGKIVYKGYRPVLDQEPMCTMLAIHNKRTGKIKLVQAERWGVAPVLNGKLNSDHNLGIDKFAALNKQFGSKKAKRRTDHHEKMKVSGDFVHASVDDAVSDLVLENRDETESEESTSNQILPSCNRDATDVTDVYNINDIVPKNILKTLYDVEIETVETILEGKSAFFKQALETIKQHSNPSKRIAVLLYIEALCTWLKLPIKGAKKHGTEVCPFSTEVNDYVIETYSVPSLSGRLRPNIIKDKGILHCMILALAISNYSLDLELFALQIGGRISLKKLTDFARIICAVPLKSNKKTVVLKLPLPPLLSSFGKRKGRKQ